MHKSTFDEDQLEKLLQSMPKVKDHQDPEQLFAKISSRLDEENVVEKKIETKRTKRKKKIWFLPLLASISAVAIIAIVVPSFLHQQDSTMEKEKIESREEKTAEGVRGEHAKNFTMMAKEGEESPIARMVMTPQSHVITDLLENQEIITVAVPDPNAMFVVPLSFIVPKDAETTKLERIQKIKEHLHEEEWGLSGFILEGVRFSEENDGKKLIINVPRDHQFGNGSTMETIFTETVKETAKGMGYEVVEFQTDGKPGIVLGNFGKITKINLTNPNAKEIYYNFEPNGVGQKFLVPIQMGDDFSGAIEAMKLPNELGIEQLKPSITKGVNFKSIVFDQKKKIATIEFREGTNIENDENSLLMIEAILMTAKEYGAQVVEFKNGPDSIGPYNLLKPINVPLAVNPMPY